MIKKPYRIALIIAVTVILFVTLLILTIKTPSLLRVESISFESMENGIIEAKTTLLIQNNNWFSYHIKDASVKIRYNEKIICEGDFTHSIHLTKSQESFHELKLNFFVDSLKWELPGMMFKDSLLLDITLKGNVSPYGIGFETTSQKSIPTKNLLKLVTNHR